MNVIHCVGNMNMAGIETFIMNIYRNIDKERIQFAFLCQNDEPADYDEEILRLGGRIFHLGQNAFKMPFIFRYVTVIIKYYKFFSNHKEFQCVHIHNHHAFDSFLIIFGCKLARVQQIIIHSHNTFAPHTKLNDFFAKILSKMKIVRLACGVDAGKWLYGKKGKFQVINNGIDTSKFAFSLNKRLEYRKKFEIKENEIALLHIGRFEKQKNHTFLINVFNEYYKTNNSSKLFLIGEGELKDEIKKMVARLECKNNVFFLGKQINVEAFFSMCDIFLLPSLFEGLPVTAIEAQSTGIACLFSDDITKQLQINPNIGFISRNSDLNFWVEAIDNILHINFKRIEGSINIDKANYSVQAVVNEITRIYLNEV